jgi:hypothetical protein
MPYFVRIGPIRTNWTKVGSRGYHIFRRGRRVFHRWGHVEVKHGPKFFWSWYQEGEARCRNEKEAAEWLAAEVQRRMKREKYQRLPPGQRILTRSKRVRRQ